MKLISHIIINKYKWIYLFGHSFRSVTVNKADSFMWILTTFVQLGATLLVYFILDKNSFNTNFTYLIVGTGFIFNSLAEYSIGDDIQKGKFSARLMQPTNVFGYYFFRCFGAELLENLAKIALYSIVLLLSWNYLKFPINHLDFFFFGIGAIIAFIINTLLSFITGFVVFWLTTYHGMASLVGNIQGIMGGNTIPLDLLVKSFGVLAPVVFLPFAYPFYRPMQIFLGKDNSPILTILEGIIWCFILWIIARLVYRFGLKRNEAVGM
jgi:ABC-2 type transport system permease protein